MRRAWPAYRLQSSGVPGDCESGARIPRGDVQTERLRAPSHHSTAVRPAVPGGGDHANITWRSSSGRRDTPTLPLYSGMRPSPKRKPGSTGVVGGALHYGRGGGTPDEPRTKIDRNSAGDLAPVRLTCSLDLEQFRQSRKIESHLARFVEREDARLLCRAWVC